MSYRNNQFYYADSAGEESKYFNQGGTIPPADNPPFIYPDSTIRVVDPDSKRPSGLSSRKLERGYIRSLLTEAQGQQVPLKKCRFQFNPAQLAQSVSMNSSMLNFFQQDPAQLAQPLGSEVSFAFDVFFDRSMEMNNPRDGIGDPGNPWATSSPSEVGVLRDIASFYSVIGQGISADQVDFAKAQYTNTLNAEFNNAEGSIEDADRLEALDRLSDYTSNLSVNVGNTAFLMPLPVRVLFSSLYMVEGYVTNTTVVYTKFNTSMVPMQATMSVSMRALYIGFAKKDTFVTENIKKSIEAEEQAVQDASEDRASKDDAYTAALNELTRLKYVVKRDSITSLVEPVSLSDILAMGGLRSKLAVSVPNADRSGVVVQLYERGGYPLSINFSVRFRVYGPFDNLSQIQSDGKPASTQVDLSPLITVSYSSDDISSAGDWREIVGVELMGESVTPSNSFSPGDLTATKFYSVVVDGTAAFKYGDATVTGKVVPKNFRGQGTDASFFGSDQEGFLSVVWTTALSDTKLDELPPIPNSDVIPNLWDDIRTGASNVVDTILGSNSSGVSSVGAAYE